MEAAVGSVVLLTALVCAIDVARLSFYRLTLKHAMSEAARYATTGQKMPDPNHPGQTLTRDASILAMVQQYSMGIPVTSSQVSISAVDASGNYVIGGGQPGDLVTISITYSVPVFAPILQNFFPSHQYTFTTSTTFQNEEFKTSRAPRRPPFASMVVV